MNEGAAHVIQADAARLPLPDESVDLLVTSPPYFALRSYTDGGEHYAGQIGAEPTPQDYIVALIACTREWVRVLKPEGSIFVNLGDKYSSGSGGQSNLTALGQRLGSGGGQKQDSAKVRSAAAAGVPPKCLLMLPERYRIAAVDTLGLIARAVIVWCLSGGAKVYARTPSGDRPIMLRDLYRAYRPEDVQLWNGEQWTQVRGWNKTTSRDGALELELRTGERVGCLSGHRWPTNRGLLRADELRVGDVIDSIRLPEPDEPRRPAALDDDDIGWIVGLYIAEGSRSATTVQIAGHVDEHARHARLRRIAASLDATCNVYQTSENGSTCNLHGSVLVGVLDRYVTVGTAKTKRLRHTAWQRSDRFLAAVVEGYLSGDGHYDAKNQRWRLGFTSNDEWAADLRTLAARLGAPLKLRRGAHRMGDRTFPGWRGEWRWERSEHFNAKPDGEVVAIRRSRARDFYDLGVADEPHTFALASGLLTHNSKPNGLPESVTDRVRRSHEDWVHLTKRPRYFSAVDEIRTPHADTAGANARASWRARTDGENRRTDSEAAHAAAGTGLMSADRHALGALPPSVWTIATEPLRLPDWLGVDHFAAFPTEWPRRLIQGFSPSGVCVECGTGRRPVVEATYTPRHGTTGTKRDLTEPDGRTDGTGMAFKPLLTRETRITGYTCDCPAPTAPTRPSVVLDPFGGTGTTALVAHALGRVGISVDLSHDYSRVARWRTDDPDSLAKVRGRMWADRQLTLGGVA